VFVKFHIEPFSGEARCNVEATVLGTMRSTFVGVLFIAIHSCYALTEQETPISRVVKLLKGLAMKAELDGKKEEDLYEAFVCWAKTIIGTKTESNAAARSKIEELESYVADIEAGRIEFSSERKDLEKEIKELFEDIESATALRKKENEEFSAAKDEMNLAIDGLDKAIKVLDEATKDAKQGTFLQRNQAILSEGFSARLADAAALQRAIELGRRSLTSGDAVFLRRLLTGDVPKPDWKKLNRKANFKKKYKARSFKIQDILKDMSKTLKSNLKDAQKKEKKAKSDYEKLKKAKDKSKAEAQEALTKMEDETGSRQMSKEEAQTELKSLKSQVKQDDGFIKQTKASLAEKKKDWKARKELRTGEIAAFSKAIEILNNDEARDLRKRSFESQGYMLLQEEGTVVVSLHKIESAASVLREASQSGADMRLAAMAGRVSIMSKGHFDDVISSIDKMVKTLKDEEASDLENKEDCEESRAEDTRKAIALSRAMDDATDEITRLASEIEEIKSDIKDKEKAKAKAKEELEGATRQRQDENTEFKANLKDDKEMASVLAKAKAVLEEFYKENDLALLQRQPEVSEQLKAGEAPPPPPSTWDKPYGGKTQVSMGVVAVLEIIEDDVQKDIDTAKAAEKKTKEKYDTFKKETDDLIKDLSDAVTDLSEAQGDKEDDIATQKKERSGNNKELASVLKTIEDANPGCEYLTIAYPKKLKNRQIEIDGLRKAKGILQSAKFD